MSGHSGFREKCGVFGVYAPGEDVARLTFYGIYALQHRGQESAGIATADGKSIHLRLGMGLVSQVFDEDDLRHLPGHIAIGHTRYSTTGSSGLPNAQPILVEGIHGPLAVAHNGNLVNAEPLRYTLEEMGFQFRTSTDTEVIAHLLASAPGSDWRERIANVMRVLKGAYSLVALTPDALMADWSLVPGQTLAAIKALVAEQPELRVLLLLPDVRREYREAAWGAGACACVPRDRIDPEWLQAMLCVMNRAKEREARLRQRVA